VILLLLLLLLLYRPGLRPTFQRPRNTVDSAVCVSGARNFDVCRYGRHGWYLIRNSSVTALLHSFTGRDLRLLRWCSVRLSVWLCSHSSSLNFTIWYDLPKLYWVISLRRLTVFVNLIVETIAGCLYNYFVTALFRPNVLISSALKWQLRSLFYFLNIILTIYLCNVFKH